MIRVEGLTRSYGDFTAVDDVSFQIGAGEIVGLLGHNGAGKTTIMKMLTGFLEPTAGAIEIDGLDIKNAREVIQKKIGYLPENYPVYQEMTVIDCLDNAVGLHELDILVLDEPTNGLDPSQVQHMRDLIKEAAQHVTVIISTHTLQEVQAVCDRVIIIRGGKKVLDERMENLCAGNRLLVTVKAIPGKVEAAMKKVKTVQSIERLEDDSAYRHYALAFKDPEKVMEYAPCVATALLNEGCWLYGLKPEQRTLESVFIEASMQQGGFCT